MAGDAAGNWMTIWQSELAALATDREIAEGWAEIAGTWARAGSAFGTWLGATSDDAPGRTGSAASARPTPSAAHVDAGLDGTLGLAQRVAELERRLAGLERG